jgi:hypothetical protein
MPERVVALAGEVNTITSAKVAEIKKITQRTEILAMNARIEAAHAGEAGRSFSVVAHEVTEVSQSIASIATSLVEELATKSGELYRLGQDLVSQVRGGRLVDLALNQIDIIDRNLYERSCDVRWWATDSAVVDACADPTEATRAFASKRLGVILDSYTVYLDLWVADVHGAVIANGRPRSYPTVVGASVAGEPWFRQALATASGAEFAVADIETNRLLGGRPVATYSTAIRAGGDEHGRVIGVLGIHFDWESQSQGVVDSVRLAPEEVPLTRCMILDSHHRVIASTHGMGVLREVFPLDTSKGASGYYTDPQRRVVGYAVTPGYETYRGLGWFGVIVQQPTSGR